MIAALTHEELQMYLVLCAIRGWDQIAYDIREEMTRRQAAREKEYAEMS